MAKENCFAYRFDGRRAECDALNVCNCEGCRFYKPASSVERYETKHPNGTVTVGYVDKRNNTKLARLYIIRDEVERQIKALEK